MTGQKWILLAEDDEHDADLALRALSVNLAPADVIVARDGAEALDCLYRRGAFEKCAATGYPTLVMLDLKMPRVDGLEALREIKADPRFKAVPVVMFTSSKQESDVAQSYDLGVNAYVVKPVSFKQLMTAIREIQRFWLNLNELPAGDPAPEQQPQPAMTLPALVPVVQALAPGTA